MKDKRLFTDGSSLFVSTPFLVVLALGLTVAALLHQRVMSLALAVTFFLCLCSRLWGENALKNMRMECRAQPGSLFPPGEVELCYTVKNDKLLPLLWMELVQPVEEDAPLQPREEKLFPAEVAEELPDGSRIRRQQLQLRRKSAFITGGETVTWRIPFTAAHRGIFRAGDVVLRSGDGFGLTQTEAPFSGTGSGCVAVYPRLRTVRTDLFLRNAWDVSAGKRGVLEDPTELRFAREYAPGDPAKAINWRMTAKSQRMVVNTFEKIQPRRAWFLLDTESFNGLPPHREELEDMLSVITSLVLELSDAGVLCTLSLPEQDGVPAQTFPATVSTPTEDILFALAGLKLRKSRLSPEGKPVFLPTRFREEDILSHGSRGRLYYVTYDAGTLPPGGLLSRSEGGVTVISVRGGASASGLPVVPLEELKGGAHG